MISKHKSSGPVAVVVAGLLAAVSVTGGLFFIQAPAAQAADDAKKAPHAEVTFTGFHVFPDGSSRIWVRLTRGVNVEEHVGKGKVSYVLKGAKVPGRNNKNALITSHFSSSVMSARLLPKKRDAELVIELKQDVQPKHRVVTRPDGTSSVQIDFPAPVVKNSDPAQ